MNEFAAQAKRLGQVAGLERLQAKQGIDVQLDDGVGIGLGNLLDVDAALAAGHDERLGGFAVEQHGKVKFVNDLLAAGNKEGVNLAPSLAGLLGDDGVAEHGLGFFVDVVGRLAEVHAALEAVLEHALAPAAGVNLDLEHDHFLAGGEEPLGDGARLDGSRTGLPPRDFDPVAREQLLGLVFVKVHFSQSPKRRSEWLRPSGWGIKRIE